MPEVSSTDPASTILESRAIEIATETLAASTDFRFVYRRSRYSEQKSFDDGTFLPPSWLVTFYFEPTTEYSHGTEPLDRGDFEICVVVNAKNGDAMILRSK